MDEPMMEETDELEESNEEDIVAEVARRVAARLQREAKQTEVVDQLAERIMKRLTK
jgi:anaerobic ribonucleoside-triphosphate reductase